jgi:hypothetical protein
MPLLVQVVNGNLQAQGMVGTYPLDLTRSRRPPTGLAFEQNRRYGKLSDPIKHLVSVIVVETRGKKQAMDLLSVDEQADLAPILAGVVARATQLDAYAERRGRGTCARHDWGPIEVKRWDDHADGKSYGGAPGLASHTNPRGQRSPTVHPRYQPSFGEGRDVTADGQFADAELTCEVAYPHGSLSSKFGEQPLLPLRAEEPFCRHECLTWAVTRRLASVRQQGAVDYGARLR